MSWFKKMKNRMDTISSKSKDLDMNELQVDKTVEDLKNELAEAQVRVASLAVTVREQYERSEEIQERAGRRRDEAKLAVMNQDDHAARLALMEEQDLRRQCEVAKQSGDEAQNLLIQMRSHLSQLENQIRELESRRDEYKARLETAELAKMTADIQAGIDSRGRAFARMEEKVVRMELEASAHEEVAGYTRETDNVDNMLEELRTMLKEEPPTT